MHLCAQPLLSKISSKINSTNDGLVEHKSIGRMSAAFCPIPLFFRSVRDAPVRLHKEFSQACRHLCPANLLTSRDVYSDFQSVYLFILSGFGMAKAIDLQWSLQHRALQG